ncbi:hypothetical protein [Rubricoccus marinus]|uniref:Uncharacterized protein n=1 Tax=Rubricoccus marinus TaxID=716817 RepID=A0A259U1P2_9BACT|nr:hypothetical protein [Rubricoccus marinus]OZC03856.1 hypothetical protein BSZ36_13195 [Rubricoccus marinus]
MFKNISIFALAFAFIGLTGCSDNDTVETTEIDGTEAEVVTPVVPSDETIEGEMEEAGAEMEAGMEEMEATGEEMMNDAEAGMEEVEAEVDGQ